MDDPLHPVRDASRPSGAWYLRLSALVISQSSQNFSLGALALLLPLIRQDIEMSFAEAGALSVVMTIAYAGMQVPAGYLGDKLGARRVMLFGLVALNVLTVVMAIAPTYLFLAVLLVALGAVRALAFAPGLALITAEFPGSRRATAMSLFMASGFLANLVLSLAAPLLVDQIGWRGIIALFGVASLAPVVFYWIVSRQGSADPRPLAAATGGAASILRQPIVWLSAVVQFTRLGVMSSIRFWLPTYLVVDKGFDLGTAAIVVAVASALSIITTLVGAQVSDRRQQPVPVILISLTALAVGLVLLTQVHEFVLILLVTGGIYVFVQAYSGSLFEVPLLVLGTRSAGTLNGFGNGWANVGGLVMTFVLGVSKDATTSFDAGWIGLAVLCLVAIVATLFILRLLRHHAQRVDVTPATAAPSGYDA